MAEHADDLLSLTSDDAGLSPSPSPGISPGISPGGRSPSTSTATPPGSRKGRAKKRPSGISMPGGVARMNSEYLVKQIVERDSLTILSETIGAASADSWRRSSVSTEKLANIQDGDGRRVELVKQKIGRVTQLDEVKTAGAAGTAGADLKMIRKVLQIPGHFEESIKAIHNELKILKDVKSCFIVKYYGAFVESSQQEVHIFMEYMDGGSFASLMPRVGRFPEAILARVAHGSASGLSYLLENHNAIHRDIKPGNILVNTAGEVKICDFGTARVMENVERQAITFIGTMVYMSPERVEGRTHGSAGDVWALGVTLLEMAIGFRPIPAPTGDGTPALAPVRVEGQPFDIKVPVDDNVKIPFAIVNEITTGPPLRLPAEGNFSEDFREVIAAMLDRDDKSRISLAQLLLPTGWAGGKQADTATCATHVQWALSEPTLSTRGRPTDGLAHKLSTNHI